MERWCGFSRRRFPGSVEGDRFAAPREGFRRLAAAVEGGRDVFSGEGWRVEDGWTRRAMGLLAMVIEGPALPERGFRGVDAPVEEAVRGGSRVLWFSSEGSWGSGCIEPSF